MLWGILKSFMAAQKIQNHRKKMAMQTPGVDKHVSNGPRISQVQFFVTTFFHVMHDRLSEKWTTTSLLQDQFWKVLFLPLFKILLWYSFFGNLPSLLKCSAEINLIRISRRMGGGGSHWKKPSVGEVFPTTKMNMLTPDPFWNPKAWCINILQSD